MSKQHKGNLALASLVEITGLAGILLILPTASADTTTSRTAAVTVSEVCTMTTSPEGSNDSPHTATLTPGVYQANIGKTTIRTICNDNSGFSIYAIGYTNEEYGNTTLRPSTLDPTGNSIITGTAISAGNPDTSNWAMKLTASTGMTSANILSDTDGAYSSYHKVPTAYTKVATMSSSTNATTGASIEATYAAYISGDQPADTYNGKVKYTMVHPASAPEPFLPHEETTTSGKICYYPNTDEYEGTMGCQNVQSSVRLLASNFSRDGYGFAGWSNRFDYETSEDNDLKFYGPQETITLNIADYYGSNSGLSLYAVWIKSEGNLQDTTKVAELCGTGMNALTTAPTDGTANLSSVSALTDQRDHQTYAIAKLADDKCWMIENLRLESRDTVGQNRFDSSIANASLAQGYGTSATYGNFGGLANAESAGFTWTYTANSLYYSGTQEGTASINIGTSDFPDDRMPRYNNLNTQSRAQNSPNTNWFSDNNTDGGMYSYGNYYTWYAIIASLTSSHVDNQSITSTSLCPTGWHLPRSGDKTNEVNSEFWSLVVNGINGGIKPANYDSETRPYYNGTPEGSDLSSKLRTYPNNFLYSGFFAESSTTSRGSYGGYWSSTENRIGASYLLLFGTSSVWPAIVDNTYRGYTVRCVSGS